MHGTKTTSVLTVITYNKISLQTASAGPTKTNGFKSTYYHDIVTGTKRNTLSVGELPLTHTNSKFVVATTSITYYTHS